MDPTAALVIALVIAALLVAAFSRSKVTTLMSGLLTRDRKGRLSLVLTPARRKSKKRPKKHGRGRR